MPDQSHLDLKYFLDVHVYNCPFCNRRNVAYQNLGRSNFDWSNSKECHIWRVKCSSCEKVSMHLTFEHLRDENYPGWHFRSDVELDDAFFYSVPTSFFAVDSRIPKEIRQLISEAEGCRKMNYLTGASACTRKAIYVLLLKQKAAGENYDDKIKDLRTKFPTIDEELFEILGHIKDMTSDHVHEQNWVAWDTTHLQLFLETLKTVLHEIYVLPDEKKTRSMSVRSLKEKLELAKADKLANARPREAK